MIRTASCQALQVKNFVGGAVDLWSVCLSLDRMVWVQALTGDIVLHSRQASLLSVPSPPSKQVFKWVPVVLGTGVPV